MCLNHYSLQLNQILSLIHIWKSNKFQSPVTDLPGSFMKSIICQFLMFQSASEQFCPQSDISLILFSINPVCRQTQSRWSVIIIWYTLWGCSIYHTGEGRCGLQPAALCLFAEMQKELLLCALVMSIINDVTWLHLQLVCNSS